MCYSWDDGRLYVCVCVCSLLRSECKRKCQALITLLAILLVHILQKPCYHNSKLHASTHSYTVAWQQIPSQKSQAIVVKYEIWAPSLTHTKHTYSTNCPLPLKHYLRSPFCTEATVLSLSLIGFYSHNLWATYLNLSLQTSVPVNPPEPLMLFHVIHSTLHVPTHGTESELYILEPRYKTIDVEKGWGETNRHMRWAYLSPR